MTSTFEVVEEGEAPIAPWISDQIPVWAIVPSKTNPRRSIAGSEIEELAQSVKKHGILQPILLRRVVEDGEQPVYEIVAGHRRFAAAKLAELEKVPAIVSNLTDVEALEIQVVENLQRADLHPLEEAEGYRQLLLYEYDVARIAERIGRSVKYVYDRVKLLSLTEDAQRLFLEDRFTAGHAVILARLKPEDQARALSVDAREDWRGNPGGPLFVHEYTLFSEDDEDSLEEARELNPYTGMKVRSVRELQAWVDEHVRFDRSADDVVDLFPETHTTLRQAEEEAEKVVLITRSYMVPPDGRGGEKILGERSWRRADGEHGSETCQHSVTGVIAIGHGRGQAFKVCTAKEKCKTHWADWQRERAQVRKVATKKGATGEERQRVEQDNWKKRQEREEAEEARRAKALPAVKLAIAEAIKKLPAGSTGKLADILIESLSTNRLLTEVPRGKWAEDLVRHLAYNTIFADADPVYELGWKELEKTVRPLGVDIGAILKKEAPPVQTSAKPEAKAPAKKAKKK